MRYDAPMANDEAALARQGASAERAVAEVQRRHDIRPWGCCAVGLLGLLPRYLPALWSPRNQTLPERVAGTIVVVERGR